MNIQLAFFCCFEVDEPSFPLRSSPCPSLADEVPHLREDGADVADVADVATTGRSYGLIYTYI